MAQAALQEEMIPSGGIADFIMSDAEIAALESEETKQQFGTEGIARFEPIAKRMASYGRYGDDQVAHVETGELLVPRALIEGNPELKESIFSHLRDMGVENPERYVVGSGANSINPETGMPEFFFKKLFKSVKKAVSKIAKGVGKVFKKVGKVLKKVAPAVLTVAGTAAFGPIYGAAFGSGIGTLIQGGNIGDALKASIKAGALGGISAGLASKFQGKTFLGGLRNAADFGNVSAGLESVGKAATGDFSGFSMSNMSQGPTAKGGTAYQAPAPAPAPETTVAETLAGATDVTPAQVQTAATDVVPTTTSDYAAGLSTQPPAPTTASAPTIDGVPDLDVANVQQNLSTGTTSTASSLTSNPPPPTEQSFLDTAGDYMFRGGQTVEDVNKLKDAAYADVLARTGDKTLAQQAFNAAGPGLIAKYGPSLALAGAGAAAGGFFDAPPEEENELAEEFKQTGADLVAQSPEQFMLAGRDPRYSTGPTIVGTDYGYRAPTTPFINPFIRPQMRAADGGEVYPRRNGGIMLNEGIPDQDSVRALLMPGEFVMTKDAVRGLGNGNLNQGINNMYGMMRNLETRGRRMA